MKKIMLILVLLALAGKIGAQQMILPVSPYDGDTLETNYPAFSWLTNGNLTFRDSYSFVLVELKSGQNPEEGINTNLSCFRLENMTVSQLMYPFDAPPLKDNVWYAWQVQKKEGGILTDKSEAWKFIISRPQLREDIKYVSLQKELNGNTYETVNNKVYFKLEEKYYSEQIRLEVYNNRMEKILDEATNDSKSGDNSGLKNKKTIGTNYYELDVSSLKEPGFYTLVVYNSKKQAYQLKFRIP